MSSHGSEQTRIINNDQGATRVVESPGVRHRLVYLSEPQARGIPVVGSIFIVGRHSKCNLVLDDPSVSTQHAKITVQNSSLVLEDLGSLNGTQVNGRAVKRVKLCDGDKIAFGDFTMQYRCTHDVVSSERGSRRKCLVSLPILAAAGLLLWAIANKNTHPRDRDDANLLSKQVSGEQISKNVSSVNIDAVPHVELAKRVTEDVATSPHESIQLTESRRTIKPSAKKVHGKVNVLKMRALSEEKKMLHRLIDEQNAQEMDNFARACHHCGAEMKMRLVSLLQPVFDFPELLGRIVFVQSLFRKQWLSATAVLRLCSRYQANAMPMFQRLIAEEQYEHAKRMIDLLQEAGMSCLVDSLAWTALTTKAELYFEQAYALEPINPERARDLYLAAAQVVPKQTSLADSIAKKLE